MNLNKVPNMWALAKIIEKGLQALKGNNDWYFCSIENYGTELVISNFDDEEIDRLEVIDLSPSTCHLGLEGRRYSVSFFYDALIGNVTDKENERTFAVSR